LQNEVDKWQSKGKGSQKEIGRIGRLNRFCFKMLISGACGRPQEGRSGDDSQVAN
jgi:hypothetical protein